MDKEELLQKSRITHIFSDEAKNNQTKTVNSYGLIGLYFVLTILLIYNLIMKIECSQILGIYFTYQAFASYGCHRASRERIDFIMFVVASVAAISALLIYVVNTLGL